MRDFIKIFLIVALSVVCIASEGFAATLESVNIKPAHNNFEVSLTPNIKSKKSFSRDKMILTLKNTTLAPDFKMSYDNADLDNIVFKTKNNDTEIIIKSNKIVPPAKEKHTGFLIFGFITMGVLFSRLISTEKEDVIFKPQHLNNLDYILQHKTKQQHQKHEELKIAA